MSRIIGVLALAGVLAACSAVKTLYNQAPDLAYWYLDGYVDFNGAQSLQVKSGLNRLQAWHRKTQLPAYIETLQKVQERMPSNISPAQACDIFSEVRSKLLVVSSQVEPVAAVVASTLSAGQLQTLETKFAKSNAEYREEFIEGTAQEKRDKRLKKAVKRAEMLYGSLDESQVETIAQSIDRSRFNPTVTFTEWQRRQQDVLQTFRTISGQPTSPEKNRAAIHDLIERTADSPDPAYRSYARALTEQSCQSFADLHNRTTAAQRKKAVINLRGYEQDFRTLTGPSPA